MNYFQKKVEKRIKLARIAYDEYGFNKFHNSHYKARKYIKREIKLFNIIKKRG